LRAVLVRLLPPRIFNFLTTLRCNYLGGYSNVSYSQEGEDLILSRIFEKKNIGFYIDVGAHHPKRFSNTYLFYKKGWNGINIDAMPGSMKIFERIRKRDINLEIAISEKKEELTYYIFNEKALNTFSGELAKSRTKANKQYLVESEKVIKTKKLADVLDKYLPTETEIDFLTIDAEGLDLEVLKSNNWEKYVPKIILVELLNVINFDELKNNEISNYLHLRGYEFFAKTFNTVFFRQKRVNK